MAKNKNNVLTSGFSGTIGQMVTFRQRAGKTILAKPRRSHPVTTSEKYLAARARFQTSVEYAKKVVKDPAAKSMYAAKIVGGQTAFNLALGDAYYSPIIIEIRTEYYHGAAGDIIKVKATDNFKVDKVTVNIFRPDGGLLEAGEATDHGNEIDWTYTVKMSNTIFQGTRISATAADLPGNTHSMEVIVK